MAIIAGALKNDSYWPQNHFLLIITPKLAYIYPNNFLRENFSKKILVPWDSIGYLGSYLGIPSVEYFPNVLFWTSWAPWPSPYLQMFWDPPKNLNNFQGAVWYYLTWIICDTYKVMQMAVEKLYFFSSLSNSLISLGSRSPEVDLAILLRKGMANLLGLKAGIITGLLSWRF